MSSLSRLLEDKMFRGSVDQCVNFPTRWPKEILRTTPGSVGNIDFGAVGTAYDYCLRLALIRTHNLGPEVIKSFPGYSHYLDRYKSNRNVRDRMEHKFSAIDKYLNFDLCDALKLFEASLFLAKFDSEFRSGYPIDNFAVKPQDIEELARIVAGSSVAWTLGQNVVLGPVFNRSGSKMAIKADGDLIIGTTLVDVKTSSRMELKASFRQLLGYFALNMLARAPSEIDRVAVYYPRFDFFYGLPVTELLTESQRSRLITLFRSALNGDAEIPSLQSGYRLITTAEMEATITDENGNSLLHHAVADRDHATAANLLQAGADVNAANNAGDVPLDYAVFKKDLGMVKLLLEAGANVIPVDRDQKTPLLMAIELKHEKLADLLLKAGADVNCQDDEGWTPLHQAVLDNQTNLAALLIQHGANSDLEDLEGLSPLGLVSERRDHRMFNLLSQARKKR